MSSLIIGFVLWFAGVSLIASLIANDLRNKGARASVIWTAALAVLLLWPLALYIWAFTRGSTNNLESVRGRSSLDRWLGRNIGFVAVTRDDWLAIKYRDFYDVPRVVVVQQNGSYYLFECLFDHGDDDYEQNYKVYVLPKYLGEQLDEISWTDLGHRGELIGSVPVSEVTFDETRRKYIERSALDRVLEG